MFSKRRCLDGCSSHPGRQTFMTRAARKVSQSGGSLRDVQKLAGHTSLAMTQRYIARAPWLRHGLAYGTCQRALHLGRAERCCECPSSWCRLLMASTS